MTTSSGFSDFFYRAQDGLRLHARVYGDPRPGRWPVVCLPGLTRNARDFHPLAIRLSRDAGTPRQVVAFDYRGRGGSQYDGNADNYAVPVEAGDILAGLSALGIAEAAFIGTSRGGLIIHLLGAMQPTVLKAIVLNDIGPAIEAAGLAHIRSYLDAAPMPKTFREAVTAQQEVHGADFPALRQADWERMVAALYREEEGKFVPDFDPKLVGTMTDLDLARPLPTLWPQFDALSAVPMLAIRGETSRLLSATTLEEMRRRHPGLRAITVAGQGHAPFLETDALPEEIAGFLSRAESGGVP